jgi:hypothetical protein
MTSFLLAVCALAAFYTWLLGCKAEGTLRCIRARRKTARA